MCKTWERGSGPRGKRQRRKAHGRKQASESGRSRLRLYKEGSRSAASRIKRRKKKQSDRQVDGGDDGTAGLVICDGKPCVWRSQPSDAEDRRARLSTTPQATGSVQVEGGVGGGGVGESVGEHTLTEMDLPLGATKDTLTSFQGRCPFARAPFPCAAANTVRVTLLLLTSAAICALRRLALSSMPRITSSW